MNKESRNIIFFDEQCNLCDAFINYIFKRDSLKQFFYSPLQGSTAHQLLMPEDLKLKSVIFLKGDQCFRESEAVFEIMKRIQPKWNWLFRFLPRGFFNIFYRWIARKRYQIWGQKSDLHRTVNKQKKYFLS